MSIEPDRLSSKQHWDDRWAREGPHRLDFDPGRVAFRDIHDLLRRCLPHAPGLRFLEVGSYPGSYLWYFHQHFGYEVAGLEYVEWCCEHSRSLLTEAGIDADVIHGDLFSYTPPDGRQWDVVGSFGFIEHFDDTAAVIERHLSLLAPGGHLVLVIPNHRGINGRILARVAPAKSEIHNRMSYEDMVQGLEEVGGAEILGGGYLGRLGFWNTGLYARMAQHSPYAYKAVRAPLWLLEHLGRALPNTPMFSPNAALVARKL